jgi:hypothetical protein
VREWKRPPPCDESVRPAGEEGVERTTKHMAVLTSGGEAPAMNAVIRAVVRQGIERKLGVTGVRHGDAGLIAGHDVPLGARRG